MVTPLKLNHRERREMLDYKLIMIIILEILSDPKTFPSEDSVVFQFLIDKTANSTVDR